MTQFQLKKIPRKSEKFAQTGKSDSSIQIQIEPKISPESVRRDAGKSECSALLDIGGVVFSFVYDMAHSYVTCDSFRFDAT